MANKEFIISRGTVVTASDFRDSVLKNAMMILQRDIERVTTKNSAKNQIKLTVDSNVAVNGDEFQISVSGDSVTVAAKTSLGVMYGALAISREVLKIDDFWYFMDTLPKSQPFIRWTNFDLQLPKYQTKYRGWFC